MESTDPQPCRAALRPPGLVMRLGRMGAFHPTRISFTRSLVRALGGPGCGVRRTRWEIDGNGHGRAVYVARMSGQDFSLCCFSHALDPARRTDRVIAEAWDSSYVLFDGIPGEGDLERLSANAPLQEAGRFGPGDLVLSRANRSVRLFDHVVGRLAEGRQPDAGMVASVGYLMRTTAVYGNGKFGLSDRGRYVGRPGLAAPFRLEMLAVYLIRRFTHDLVEHIAQARAPGTATRLCRDLKRHTGIGNATGLGMAPFLVNHPELLHNWMSARETALARARSVGHADGKTAQKFREIIRRAAAHAEEWDVADERQSRRILRLRRELAELSGAVDDGWVRQPFPWDRLVRWAETRSTEMQELAVSLALEPNGDLVDDLCDRMSAGPPAGLRPSMTVGELSAAFQERFAWALGHDFGDPGERHRFWYVSEEKMEPRLGARFSEPGAEKELPLDTARMAQDLHGRLAAHDGKTRVAEFLLAEPGQRHMVERVQRGAAHPYGEIRENLIGRVCLPIDMLRCKLSFFGASKFDPKSDLWTRITLFQGAPLTDELGGADADDWAFPALGHREAAAA